jgi:hypothetical protein
LSQIEPAIANSLRGKAWEGKLSFAINPALVEALAVVVTLKHYLLAHLK